jgi:DNA-directed RNA polymerase specialized sigma24 family protein
MTPVPRDSWSEITKPYMARLIALAASRCKALRHRLDPEDIVQSVFLNLYKHYDLRQLKEVDDLWPLLACITVRKMRENLYTAGIEGRQTKFRFCVAVWAVAYA